MQNLETSGFKIGKDEEGNDRPEPVRSPAPADRLRFEQLSRRLSGMMIAGVLGVFALLAFGHFEVNRRLEKFYSSDLTAVKDLSQELQRKIADMTAAQEALQKKMTDKEGPMNEALLEFEKTSGAIKNELRELDTAKADKNALTAAVKGLKEGPLAALTTDLQAIKGAVPPLQEEIKKTREALAATEQKLAALGETAASLQTVSGNIASMREELKKIKTEAVDEIAKSLKETTAVTRNLRVLEDNFDALNRKADQTIRDIRTLQQRIQGLENRVTAVETRRPAPTPGKPGGIIEQNIQ